MITNTRAIVTRILFIFFFSTPLLAQVDTQKESKVNQWVLQHVNELRDSLSLPPLQLDHVLHTAADDHSFYMSKKDKLTHFQTIFSKETPSGRVEYHGGMRTYVGENVAQIAWPKNWSDSAVGTQLFEAWKHSPPHYQNMIHPEYTRMGVSYSQGVGAQLFSAQVFSSDEIRLPSAFENTDLAWGVRPAEKTCKDEVVTYQTMFFANSVMVDGNDVYMYYHDRKFFEGVIHDDNDGLAIDVVLREQLPCHKENQFHISEVHDGEMQRPIYRWDILRNNISDNPKKIMVKIGEVPDYLKGKQWDANVIVINDNKLCDYSVPVDVPSDIYPLLKVNPYYDTIDDVVDTLDIVRQVIVNDTFHVELKYERSQGDFVPLDYDKHIQLLNWRKYIDKIEVDCFASVEGARWYNLELLEKRKESIEKLLAGFNAADSNLTIVTQENWELLEKQLEREGLSELKGKSEKEIKTYLKRNKTAKWDQLLAEQRITHVYGYLNDTITVTDQETYFLAAQYDSTLNLRALHWNKLLRDKHIIPEVSLWPYMLDSLSSDTLLRTHLLGASSINDNFRALDSIRLEKFLSFVDEENDKQVFNYAHVLTKHWFSNFAYSYRTRGVAKSIAPNQLLPMVRALDTTIIDKGHIKRMEVNILLAGIHYYTAHNNWSATQSYFDRIRALVEADNFTPEEAEGLALFCNHFHKFNISVDILHPFHENGSLSEDGKFILAKTATLIRKSMDKQVYHRYMLTAKTANLQRYCIWLDTSFQIQRDEFIKRDFCESCASFKGSWKRQL